MLEVKAAVWFILLVGGGAGAFWYALRPADRALLSLRPIVVALTLVACTLVTPNIWVLLALLAISLPLAARSRGEAAALYLVIFLALPSLDDQLSLGSLNLIKLTPRDALTLAFLVVLLLRPASTLPIARGRPRDLAFLLFFLVVTITSVRGRNATDAIRWLAQSVLTYGLPYLALSRSIREPRDLRRVILALGMMGAGLAVEAVFESKRGWPIALSLTQHLNTNPLSWFAVSERLRGGILRAAGTFVEPISFSFFLTFALLATLSVPDAFRSKMHGYLAAGAICVGLYYTGSRGGWLAAIAGVMLLDIYRQRYASLFGKAVVIAVAAVLVLLAAQKSDWLGQRLGLTGHAQGTIDYRTQLARRGMEEFAHAPLLGRSDPEVHAALRDLTQGEHIVDFVNYWLYFLLVTGIIGTAVVATAVILPAVLVARARRMLRDRPVTLAQGGFLFTAGLTPAVGLFFSSLEDRYALIWTAVFAMTASFLPMAARMAAAVEPAAVPESPEPEALQTAA